ncbi:hypothetical protein DYB28_000473 [Aphanomyces astaci]|uniref:Uncharacterized protein n=1 Tax=Aphanomyces astaci TaxID=112090 RepID=A0A397AMN1_APHAT|nr:hypothetical protein DYB25_003978 [Aphanomyces astaci]RHY14676.1 hypothetical protein DYB36_004973 [Aphanomyces astaci]RHY53771.1 hypothetical protein DYB38_010101 [Aphanomyces astaci]RHY57862.1 hypothetical protein DYB30_003794 [Aphanomyces astaci]RHY59216.1 hypothetical protein DYB34_006086 [Aphanomyces astaci]
MASEDIAVERCVTALRTSLEGELSSTQTTMFTSIMTTAMQHMADPSKLLHAVIWTLQSNQVQMKADIVTNVVARQRAVLADMAAHVVVAQPSLDSQVISRAFALRAGLCGWMSQGLRAIAEQALNDMQRSVVDKRGNDCRSAFERLLRTYMEAFQLETQGESLGQRIAKLQAFLEPSSNSVDRSSQTARQRLIWGCYGIKNVGNERSHVTGELTSEDQMEICVSVTALARTLPFIADEVGVGSTDSLVLRPPPPGLAALPMPPVYTSVKKSVVRPAAHETTAPPSAHPPPPPPSPPPAMPDKPSSPLEWHTPRAPPPRLQYSLIHVRPESLPAWPGTQKVMFERMLKHMRMVSEANLCASKPCPRSDCAKSHTFVDTMRYNPLFKLFVCGKHDHFWAKDAIEPSDCVNVHVQFNVAVPWIDEKKDMCKLGPRCKRPKCVKSHSLAEACWYNPNFKTKPCSFGSQCTSSPEGCRGYHYDSGPNCDRRYHHDDSDYVGSPSPMLFTERTHAELAKALERHSRQIAVSQLF